MRFVLAIVCALSFAIFSTSCGNGEENVVAEDTLPKLKGYVELDLAEYGYNLTVMVPDENTGVPEINATDWGNVEIKVGKAFGIQVMEGPGDFELLKSDLNSDLVYKSEILKEEGDCVVYKRVIPDTEIEPETNFFLVVEVDGLKYEIQNMKEDVYSEGAIDKMVQAGRQTKSNKGETAPAEA